MCKVDLFTEDSITGQVKDNTLKGYDDILWLLYVLMCNHYLVLSFTYPEYIGLGIKE